MAEPWTNTGYLSDHWTDEDHFFSDYRPALLDIVTSAQTPLTVGIFGTWGSGKTSLLRMLEKDIADKGTQPLRTVWFTAWKYDRHEALWRALILRVLDALYPKVEEKDRTPEQQQQVTLLDQLQESVYQDVNWQELGQLTVNWWQFLREGGKAGAEIAAAFIPGAGLFKQMVEVMGGDKQADAEMTEAAKAIRREIKNFQRAQLTSMEQFESAFKEALSATLGEYGRLIVFVDDLDRCLPEKAIEVLEAIKLFLEVPGTVFVLGMDREVVERGVEARYGALFKTGAVERGELPIRGDVYLQKIVQVPFYLPPLIADDLDHYIGALDENLPPKARLSSMTKAVFAQGLFPNPRQVKRSLNIFRLLRAIALAREARPGGLPRESVAWPLLAKTVMIQTQYPKLYSEWRQYPTLVQTLEAEYTRQPTREDETLHGRKRPKTEEAGAETEASGGLLAPYLQERRRYVYLERMLTFPESDEQSEGRQQARFEGLSREQMSVYVRLAGAVEGETPATSAQIAGDLMEELLSGDRARIREAVARVEEETLGGDDASTTDLKTHLVQIMRNLERPAKERTSAGDALGYLGDPRFREDAWRLPDDDLFGFVEIPAGPFLMGSKKDKDPQALDRELPQHELSLGGYYIARFPVTVEQFHIFAVASGYKSKDTDSLKGIPNHPAVDVTWHDARAYCDWLTQQLREAKHTPLILASLIREQDWSIKLPSEAQWEKAARGSDGLIYPWGNTVDANRANYDDTGIGGTSAVGCFPWNNYPYAVEDLSGNVWEWTLSLWGKEDKPEFAYPYDPDDGRENIEAPDKVRRVLRGGSFDDTAQYVRCAVRFALVPVYGWGGRRGFRVVCAPS